MIERVRRRWRDEREREGGQRGKEERESEMVDMKGLKEEKERRGRGREEKEGSKGDKRGAYILYISSWFKCLTEKLGRVEKNFRKFRFLEMQETNIKIVELWHCLKTTNLIINLTLTRLSCKNKNTLMF